ncbi:acyl carrier protein [Streptomyces sp. AJS327]|uniref:acyl carrier protein n=1 Tax=Streptomyces sp. AJS327 TaxID=2545265 RepID=UPI0015DE409B|nr:acyl carrier protein [Streptomyces sp. AJS327]MBA0052703.1 acyl carrier protein [Streptomyces sp. AJS327]
MTEQREQILTTVTEIVAGEIGQSADSLTPETDLRSLEGADSVKVLRMVAKIEQRYDIELEDEDVFGLSTITEVVTVVEKALAEGN